MKQLMLLIVVALVCAGCRSLPLQSNIIPYDFKSAAECMQEILPWDTQYIIATNDSESPGFRNLKIWLAEKWMISEADAGTILAGFKEYLNSKTPIPEGRYKFESVYVRKSLFKSSPDYLSFVYRDADIPEPEGLKIETRKLPLISLRVRKLKRSEIKLDPDENILRYLAWHFKIEPEVIIKINDLDPKNAAEEIKRRNKILVLQFEYPNLYLPMKEARDRHFESYYDSNWKRESQLDEK